MDKIRYGNTEAEARAVDNAAKAAGVHSFVEQLPRRYQTLIGEGGVKLSGGQRQRVALARTLLKDPALLVLDEALSAVDPESLRRIMQEIRRLRKDKTTFMITHRHPEAAPVDKIVMLNEGKIEDILRPHAVEVV
jgi:ATP-binding cassette subfamily B protein